MALLSGDLISCAPCTSATLGAWPPSKITWSPGSRIYRALYALSPREPSVAKSLLLSATGLSIAVCGISAVLSLVSFREGCDAISRGVEGAAGKRKAEVSAVNRRMEGSVVVNRAASSRRSTVFPRAC